MTRVIFVDPDQEQLSGLKNAMGLERKFWEMYFSTSPSKALQVLDQGIGCDVMVAEMELDEMSGVEFFSAMMERHPETVRIGLIGSNDSELLLKASTITHQFLTKPLNSQHLKVLVTRALAIRGHLKDNPLKKRLHDIGGLPSLPSLYKQIVDEMNSGDPSIAAVAGIIKQDLGMSAKLLQIVNSAGMGLAHEVSDVTQAASLLGLDRIRTLVLVAEMYSLVGPQKLAGEFSPEELWEHSLTVGEYAKRIAELETEDQRIIEDSFMAGLLHDIGILILAMHLPRELSEAIRFAKERGMSLIDAEKELFHATHAEVGGYLLELWGLSDPIVLAITFHDFPCAVPEENYPSAVPEHDFTALTAVHAANYFREDEEHSVLHYPPVEIDTTHLENLGFSERIEAWWDACHGPLV